MSFRCLIRNLRKMQEAKNAAPAMVPRAVADKMATALHKSIMAMGTVETVSEEDDETLGDASDACMEAFSEYEKVAKS